jgi:peptide/nickel transport system substrate-binding protein
MTFLRSLAVGALAFQLALAGAPASAQSQQPLIRVGVNTEAGTLDPRRARDTTANTSSYLIYDGLVRLSPDLKPLPNLAARWENPDPLTWIFHLRKGVKFHDGSSLTADDVVFTFQSLLDPATKAPLRSLYTPIQAIEATSPDTVRMTLSAPYSPLLGYLEMGIVSKKAVLGGANLDTAPMGSGPMKFVRWERGSRIVLESNDAYWGGQPLVKELQLVLIPGNTPRAQAFEAGALDLVQSPFSGPDLARLKGDKRFKSVFANGIGFTVMIMNTADPILSDPQLRRALAMAIDNKAVADRVYAGTEALSNAPLVPSSWAYSKGREQPGFNTEGARKELERLGWKDTNGDGILDKGGKKLTLVLSTHSESPERVESIEFIQALYMALGIDAQIKLSDWPSFSTSVNDSKFQLAVYGYYNIVDPDRLFYGQLRSGGSMSHSKYSNPELDKLLDAGRASTKIDERRKIYRQVVDIVVRDLPWYTMTLTEFQAFHNDKIKGFVPDPRGYLRGLVLDAKAK